MNIVPVQRLEGKCKEDGVQKEKAEKEREAGRKRGRRRGVRISLFLPPPPLPPFLFPPNVRITCHILPCVDCFVTFIMLYGFCTLGEGLAVLHFLYKSYEGETTCHYVVKVTVSVTVTVVIRVRLILVILVIRVRPLPRGSRANSLLGRHPQDWGDTPKFQEKCAGLLDESSVADFFIFGGQSPKLQE